MVAARSQERVDRVSRLGVILVVLAWPVFTVPVALDLYLAVSSRNPQAGLWTEMLAGGSDWAAWVIGANGLLAPLLCVAFARGWAIGRVGVTLVCWGGIVTFIAHGADYLIVGPERWVAILSALFLMPHLWAVRVLRGSS
jgi:hypothetical protein